MVGSGRLTESKRRFPPDEPVAVFFTPTRTLHVFSGGLSASGRPLTYVQAQIAFFDLPLPEPLTHTSLAQITLSDPPLPLVALTRVLQLPFQRPPCG